MARERVGRIDELEMVHRLGQAIDLRHVERQRLPHLARGAAAAVGDHVGRHRGAQLAVALIHVLDRALAAVAARQVEVDVGPLAALFRQEPLEQQVHAHGIDCCDPEAEAHGAVGGRPAALHEDVVLPAEIDDVPDDEEVAGQIQLLDEIELTRDLRTCAIVVRTVALARADLREAAQKRDLRLPGRHGIVGKPIAEIGHRVLEPIRQLARRINRLRQVAEERGHLRRRLQVALGVPREPASRRRERHAMMDAREDVEQRTLVRRCEPHAAGGKDRHVIGAGEIDERLVIGLLVVQQVPLQLHVDVRPAEGADEPIEQPADAVARCLQHLAPGERDEARGVAVEFLQCERTLPFWRPQLHPGDEPTEVAIPVGGGDEDREEPSFGLQAAGWPALLRLRPDAACRLLSVVCRRRSGGADRQLRSDDGADAGDLRRAMKSWRAVDAVAIQQRECRTAERGGAVCQHLGQRGALEKAEGGGGVKFDVRGGHG